VQQPAQAALGVLHVLGPQHQLFEQLIELQPGHLGKCHFRGRIFG
jgi:hypothetical protein